MYLNKKCMIIGFIFCLYNCALESRPLHVLFVVSYFPAPSQTYILNMMTGLIDRGHKVTIFAFRKNDVEGHPNIEKYSLLNSVIYERFPADLPDCDVVFCQSASLGKLIVENDALTPWLDTKKIVVCLRGFDITGNNIRNNPSIYEKLFKRADIFLPVCDYFKKITVQLGCPAEKVIVHHSAINCKQFFFRERTYRPGEKIKFVSVCRLIQKKGLNFAIGAIARLNKRYKNIHYTIVGSGHLQSSLRKLAKKSKILDKVTFFGWAEQDQVARILDESHIFLLPSITSSNGDEEGIANALKEAMAMGLIPVSTFHAGTPELITDGVSGYLVPEGSSKQLAKKIKYIIKHPELWKTVGLAARKKVEDEFETTQSMAELEGIFYRLLS